MATVSLGLGLATASHLYLCHRNLLQAEKERQYHAELSERCELDLLFHSLSGKALFSELIDLLDSTLLFHADSYNSSNDDDYRSRSKGCAGSKKNRRRRSSRCCASPHHRRYQQQKQQQEQQQEQVTSRSTSMLLSSPMVKVAERGTTSRKRDAKVIDNDMQQQQPQPQQQQNMPLDPSFRDRTSRNATAIALSQCQLPPPPPTSSPKNQALLRDHVELWIQACRHLRLAQERSVKETMDRIRARRPASWTLKANIIVSLVLGAGMLAGLFKDRHLLPYTNVISQLFTQLSATPTPTPSSHSSAILTPSLFLCGVHFFTAFRTQWTLSELYPPPPPSSCHSRAQQQQRQQTHLVFLDRTKAMTRCLDIREKRLVYLMQQIRAYEKRTSLITTCTTPTTAMTTVATSCTARSLVDTSRTTTTGAGQTGVVDVVAMVTVGVDDEVLRLEPSLACMSITRFLRDPIEQSRVLRIELQALREDLESLHTMMIL